MDQSSFNALCQSFPQTTHVVQWGGSDVWKVAGKVFALCSRDKEEKLGFTFKTSEQNFYFLQEKAAYRPAPYLASRGMLWIQQYDAASIEENLDEELHYYISSSYNLVIAGLSKKKRDELALVSLASA